MAKINPRRSYVTAKIDAELQREMRELAKFRYMKNLSKTEPSLPKMTKLWRRTDGYKQSIFELKTKTEKDND